MKNNILSELPFLSLERIKQIYSLRDSEIIDIVEAHKIEILYRVKYLQLNPHVDCSGFVDGKNAGCSLAIPPEQVRELIEKGHVAVSAYIVPSVFLDSRAKNMLCGVLGTIPKPGGLVRVSHEAPILIISKDDVVVSHEAIKNLHSKPDFPFITIAEAVKGSEQEIEEILRKGIERTIDLYCPFLQEKIEVGKFRTEPAKSNIEAQEYYDNQGSHAIPLPSWHEEHEGVSDDNYLFHAEREEFPEGFRNDNLKLTTCANPNLTTLSCG